MIYIYICYYIRNKIPPNREAHRQQKVAERTATDLCVPWCSLSAAAPGLVAAFHPHRAHYHSDQKKQRYHCEIVWFLKPTETEIPVLQCLSLLLCHNRRKQCHGLLMYLWWYLCTLYLLECQVRVTIGDSGLCCCDCVTFLKCYFTPLFVVYHYTTRRCLYTHCNSSSASGHFCHQQSAAGLWSILFFRPHPSHDWFLCPLSKMQLQQTRSWALMLLSSKSQQSSTPLMKPCGLLCVAWDKWFNCLANGGVTQGN